MAVARHRYHKIALVLDGDGTLDSALGILKLTAGCVVRVPAGTTHRFVDAAGTPMTLAVLCISDAATLELPVRLWADVVRLIPAGRPRRTSSANATSVRQLVRRLAVESMVDDPLVAAEMVALTTQLLVRLLRGLSPHRAAAGSSSFTESLDWLERHFTEPVDVDELAARASLSYRGYTAAFRRHTGMSVVQYITRKRITLAARLIRETADIATSAFEAGFNDLSHFYRVFVRHFGYTPGRCMDGSSATQLP